MKKSILISLLIVSTLFIASCSSKISVGGESYEEDLVKSGYYLDKASLSDATFVESLSNVKAIKRPESLGKVELPDFSTIELTDMPVTEITDEDVEAELEKERDAETTYQAVTTKRKAEMGDRVIIDYKGFVDNKEFDGGTAEEYPLVLGSGQFIPGFEEKVAGHLAGTPFSINVTFPEEYDPSLAGKKARFDITIKSIEEPIKPEIDNVFVVNHTKTNSFNVEEYKEEIRERLKRQNEFMNNENMIYQLSGELIEKSKFEPTEEALAWQFSTILEDYNKSAEESGSNLATMIATSGQSVKEVYDQIKEYTPEIIKTEMLLDELRKEYKFDVTDDEAKEWFDIISSVSGYSSQVTYEQYVETIGIDNLKKSIEGEKMLMEVAKKCKHVTGEAE